MRRYFWIGFVFVAATAVMAYVLFRFDPCDAIIERVVPSPGNGKVLTVFHRDCGATVDFNTQVSLVPSGRKFSFDDYPPFFGVSGKYPLSVTWMSESRIRIVVPALEKIYRKAKQVDGVSITYR